ncbi:MAG: serpin family protein [Candidatus Omnitrophica bacterium]|nr:serpin family protein [Candidatus Omnitrophota bacterium]
MNILRKVIFVSAAISLLLFHAPRSVLSQEDSSISLARRNNVFALNLYAKLKDRDGNIFLSPYSISTALAMTYAGARGDTATQIAQVFHFESEQATNNVSFKRLQKSLNDAGAKGSFELNAVNALWAQKGYAFLPDYLKAVKEDYNAQARELDFKNAAEASRGIINTWVEDKTKNKIQDLIPQGVLTDLTRLVLTNAIYFKGKWESVFKKDMTKDAPFNLIDGTTCQAPMMNKTEEFLYGEDADAQVLSMPYQGNDLSMVVILPKEKDGLGRIEKDINIDRVENRLAASGFLKMEAVIVSIPRFKITSEFELADTLGSMGMPNAFSESEADFSGMTGKKDLFIGAVIHKAFVDVSEEGTEAAAATAVVMMAMAAPGHPVKEIKFIVDHPFLYIIRDNNSGSILFMGRITNPLK